MTDFNLTDGFPLTELQRTILKMALEKGWEISFSPNYESSENLTVMTIEEE